MQKTQHVAGLAQMLTHWELITIDILPDDVLLRIFYYYVIVGSRRRETYDKQGKERWITLTHVCRRWRSLVFQSPRRLNLRLFCGPNTPARDTLDIWPRLPLIIRHVGDILHDKPLSPEIIAALERNDRVCQIKLSFFSSPQMAYVAYSAATRKPFPELTDLHLTLFVNGLGPIFPDSFLGGTTPRLRSLVLEGVPFPGLPKLLMSATHLVKLDLYHIPLSGYIPPKSMATSLSVLISLEYLRLHFRYPRSRQAREIRRSPPPTRSILPSLTKIEFKGNSEYLEGILARIDAPRLNKFLITFFNQLIFHTPQLFQLISRRPTLRAPGKGLIVSNSKAIIVKFPSQTFDDNILSVQIPCATSEWQLSSAEQVCTSSLPPISTLEDLYILVDRGDPPRWQYDAENVVWLELLRPFSAVKNLYLCKKTVPRIAPALEELVGVRTTEVLPFLENIFLEGLRPSVPLRASIEKLLTARYLTSHPVAVSCWDMDPEQFRFKAHGNYRVRLNNLLQKHPTGDLTPHLQYVMTSEGSLYNATHYATAKFCGETIAVGSGESKAAAKVAAAQPVYEDFLANGVRKIRS